MTIDPFAPKKSERPENFVGTWQGEPLQQTQINLSEIKSVPQTTPQVSTEVRPVTPGLSTLQNVPQVSVDTTATPVATVDPLQQEITTLQAEVTASEQELADLASGKVEAQEDAGIFERQMELNEAKAKLQELQDKQIEIPIQEKQRYAEAGVVGTKEDLRRATAQDIESAALGALAQSRLVSAQTDAINTNIGIITQEFDAKKAQLEFDITQKNARLDRVVKTYGDIMTEKQKIALEDRKHQNDLDKIEFEHNLSNTKSNSIVMLEGGVGSGSVGSFVAGSPNERDDFANRAYQNGELDANQYSKIIRDNANDRLAQAKEDEVADVLGDTIIRNAEWMTGDITKILNWKDEQGNSKLPQILGRIGQYDWAATWGEEDKQIVALLDNIFSKETLDAMGKLKGSPSDKDLALVEDAARAGIDRSINDPTHIISVLTQMKQNLNDAALKQRTLKTERSEAQNIITPSIQDVETLLQGGTQSNNVDYNKIIQAESGGSYTALNEGSGAYGKYQFIPSTMEGLAKDLNISIEQAKTPQGQEAMFKEFTNRNVASLEKANIPINTFTVYGSHQQGSYGFQQILKNNITPTIERNMLSNLPPSGRITGDTRVDWLNYWANKMT